jgi:retron-type reverse transcriptase
LRGGSWNNNNNNNFRAANRNNNNPANRNNNNGFRCASTVLQPEPGGLRTTRAGIEESRPFPGSGICHGQIFLNAGAASSSGESPACFFYIETCSMKRFSNLYTDICNPGNLLRAARKAATGKKLRPDVSAFYFYLENEIFNLANQLKTKTYQPGQYRTFYITDPKKRLISAAPFRDRVVHHAICQVIEPFFENQFIFDCYANRTNKGSHLALHRCTHFCRKYKYALKCDIQKYFPSIDLPILLEMIKRRIKCTDTLWLIAVIINNSNPQEERLAWFPGDNLFTPAERRHGIPIGNLTSQYFANIYLNGFDHYIKETLHCKAYIRYVDDFLIFSDDKNYLNNLKPILQQYLDTLRLKLHPKKCNVFAVKNGVPFLGWQVFAGHRRLKRATGLRIQKKSKSLASEFNANLATLKDIKASTASWQGHLKHGNTGGLQVKLLKPLNDIINQTNKITTNDNTRN